MIICKGMSYNQLEMLSVEILRVDRKGETSHESKIIIKHYIRKLHCQKFKDIHKM